MVGSDENTLVPQTGRRRTDKSLRAERAKTDESLALGREKTERDLDDALAETRKAADVLRAGARQDAGRAAGLDGQIRAERQAADKALHKERGLADSALRQERGRKRADQDTLFRSERKETDRNLTDERQEVDGEALRAAAVLSDERTSHTATRAALTTRDEFLAIVSHDLKNPLGAIAMAAELMKSLPPFAAADGEAREYLEVIARNSGDALRLISDLLDMERVAVGKLGLVLEDVDLDGLVRHAVRMMEPLAASRRIALSVASARAGRVVLCDGGRIAQVLSNLIGNALKFTPDHGAVTLSVSYSALEAVVAVADTGPGIPEALRRVIFERFWQLGKADRRGLGLGLYISAMMVEAHGGRIWVDSEVGAGSTFYVALPLPR